MAELTHYFWNPNDERHRCLKNTVLLGYRDGPHGGSHYFLTDVEESEYIVKFDQQEVKWITIGWPDETEVELVLRRYEHGGTHEVCKMEFESEDRARQAAFDLRMWAFGHDVMSRNY